MKVYSLLDTTDVYTKDKFVYLDRDWFKDGDVIYHNGITPIHIISNPTKATATIGWFYKIEEWMTFRVGEWFTLEKEKETKEKITIKIKIIYE